MKLDSPKNHLLAAIPSHSLASTKVYLHGCIQESDNTRRWWCQEHLLFTEGTERNVCDIQTESHYNYYFLPDAVSLTTCTVPIKSGVWPCSKYWRGHLYRKSVQKQAVVRRATCKLKSFYFDTLLPELVCQHLYQKGGRMNLNFNT